jgi:hypothetical protein
MRVALTHASYSLLTAALGEKVLYILKDISSKYCSPTIVPDPDPPDAHVFGPPGSGSGPISQRYGSGSVSFCHHAKIVRKTLIPTIL